MKTTLNRLLDFVESKYKISYFFEINIEKQQHIVFVVQSKCKDFYFRNLFGSLNNQPISEAYIHT